MSLTVCITNHNYAKYLPECLDSAERFADEILVYDDGSTDESMDILSQRDCKLVHRDDASGSPVWGSNLAIQDASCDYLMYLDADNVMLSSAEPFTDYTYAEIVIIDDSGNQIDWWKYDTLPTDWEGALRRFKETHQIPVPWGGFWKLSFLRDNNLYWRHWPHTMMAADFCTCVEWMHAKPSITRLSYPVLAFRMHEGQWSDSPERGLMEADAAARADEL